MDEGGSLHRKNRMHWLFGLLTLLWIVIFKWQSIPDQPIRVFPDFDGYALLADSLAGRADYPHMEFVLPHGFSHLLNIVYFLVPGISERALGLAFSILAGLVPLSIYLFFLRTVGPLLAFILSFCYLASSTTLRYEATLGTDTITSVLIAVILIAVALSTLLVRDNHRQRPIWVHLAMGLILLGVGTIKLQYLPWAFILAGSILAAEIISRPPGTRWVQVVNVRKLSGLALIVVPSLLYIMFLFGSNYLKESYWGLSPLGPFNKLNYTGAIFKDYEPQSPLEDKIKHEIVATIDEHGPICTLCAGKDMAIIESLDITPGEFFTILSRMNNRLIATHPEYFFSTASTNALWLFCQDLKPDDDTSFAPGYLVRFAQSEKPWSALSKFMSVVVPVDHPARQIAAGAFIFVFVLLCYRQSFHAQLTNLFIFLTVFYTVVAVAGSQNAEMYRYRAPIQWMWISYMWWGGFMILLKVAGMIRQRNAPTSGFSETPHSS